MTAAPEVLIVDAANVIGSVPDGWWRDRAGAATRLRDALRRVPDEGLPGARPPLHPPVEIVLVVEGAARGIPSVPGVRVVDAPGSGDDAIVDLVANEGRDRHCTVVTADRGLRARVHERGADVMGSSGLPRWTTGHGRRDDNDDGAEEIFPRRPTRRVASRRGRPSGEPAEAPSVDRPRAGVLFDVDGTLVDTTYLHTVAWWEAIRQAGWIVPMARIHRAIGMGSDQILDHLIGADRDRSRDEAMRAAHKALMTTHWERLKPLPGAADLLRACAGRGLKVVLASSASTAELAALRTAIDADDAVEAATSADDAERSKPAPDILQVALRKAGLDASRVIMVGDSVWDIAAASRLDIPCVALTCGGTSAAELSDAGAAAVYADPAELLAALPQSPIAKLL